MRRFLLIVLVLLLGWSAASAQEAPRYAEEALRAAFEHAKAAVQEEFQARFDETLILRIVEPEQLAERVAEENRPMLVQQYGEELGASEAALVGRTYSRFVYAKFAWSTGEFLFVPETLEKLIQTAVMQAPKEASFLEAVMVHELIHALDHQRYHLDSLLLGLANRDAVQAFNALLEGHAQFQTRRLCAKRNWSAGFERMLATLNSKPSGYEQLNAAERLVTDIQLLTVTTSYNDGELFIAALDAAGGMAAIERAWRALPDSMELIYHPGWFLEPASRPALEYDFDQALELAAAAYPEGQWTHQLLSITPAQLRLALSLLEAETIEKVVRDLRQNRMLVLTPVDAPGSQVIALAIYDLGSEEGAQFFLAAAKELNPRKDEALKEGNLRLIEAKYEAIEQGRLRGLFSSKRLSYADEELLVCSTTAASGRLAFETVFSVASTDLEQQLELLRTLQLNVRKPKAKPEPASPVR